ncbi:MAG: (d)CMP kinase [Deltaproteobacteria bacterium]|jgi:CMP/dCMP kinase|nr:(d)CMP kinase [Deltaproteobacteria bacterium]MBT4086929.1 (d)CMP kinase [Deltaproteobacteria bacterium]MBT4266344.1 (d)CMP kinase [Deltaproteobacteria bacterium]MBT4643972.1 (d)CMP kinase [Deltaproteobacteria bacterium]MBT6502568.1 (d)CMP kinase [Deltaproteobacteria bacterium]
MTVIALDGPAGSGKSTVAKHLSQQLKFEYIDSGAIYRSLTFYGLQYLGAGCQGKEEEIANWFSENPDQIKITYEDHTQIMWLKGSDISRQIRSPEVTREVRFVSDSPACREIVNQKMRDLAEKYDVVIDGRDIGTKVFPETRYKFYLDGKPEIRVARRAKEMNIPLQGEAFDQLLKGLLDRDASDMAREIAPLCQAEDAVLVDTSALTVDEVVETIRKHLGSS